MPCAPLESYEEPASWTPETSFSATDRPSGQEQAIAITAENHLERAYRVALRENGLSAGEGVSLFDHMRAIGLLPPTSHES